MKRNIYVDEIDVRIDGLLRDCIIFNSWKEISFFFIMTNHLPSNIESGTVFFENSMFRTWGTCNLSLNNSLLGVKSSQTSRNYLIDIFVQHPLSNINPIQRPNVIWIW
jgi:hypothetical protein